MQSELNIAEQVGEDSWEGINKDRLQWEGLPILFPRSKATINSLNCGILTEIKHTLYIEVIEHDPISFFYRFNNIH